MGLTLQGIPYDSTIIIGRIIYGWAIFQGVVKFDVLVFELSSPESYAIDYSKVHFFQNLGVLLASLNVGILVEAYGLNMPFGVACIGFLGTILLYFLIFKFSLASKQIPKTS